MPACTSLLAQIADSTDRSDQLLADILPWLIVLVGVVLAGGLVIYLVRRYVYAGEDQSGDGFTLHDLRQLNAAGELTDEEFAKAKAAMIGRLKSEPPNNSATDHPPPNNQSSDAADP